MRAKDEAMRLSSESLDNLTIFIRAVEQKTINDVEALRRLRTLKAKQQKLYDIIERN